MRMRHGHHVMLSALWFSVLSACGQGPAKVSAIKDVEPVSGEVEPIPTRDPRITCTATDLIARLRCIEGVTVKQVSDITIPSGWQRYDLNFTQPVDHERPDGETFQQRVVLLHRNDQAPMFLQTSGYTIFGVRLLTLARDFQANQIQVEHRFFAGSTPANKDWSKVDIRQAAADFHRITVALKSIYQGNWVNTGASKGGMTSVFHRRFYPNDLAGTLALVAPLSFSTEDERYVSFVDQVGGDRYKECRAALEALQRSILSHREAFMERMTGNFAQLGSKEIALEHTVLEMPFIYFQYQDPNSVLSGCQRIPNPATASLSSQWEFLKIANDPATYSDEGMVDFVTYYFQAATQLGSPASKMSHLADVLRFPETYKINAYIPRGVEAKYDGAVAMRDIESWVATHSERIMFVYGELDPWTAGHFTARGDDDNHYFVVPGGNHSSDVGKLPSDTRKEANAILARWLGVPGIRDDAARRRPMADDDSLEALEAQVRARHRL